MTLAATDNQEQFIHSITFSAMPHTTKGGQTIARTIANGNTAQVVINTEGITTLSFFATSNAGEVENPV